MAVKLGTKDITFKLGDIDIDAIYRGTVKVYEGTSKLETPTFYSIYPNLYTTIDDNATTIEIFVDGKSIGEINKIETIDLTTLNAWNNLSYGDHTVSIKVKADNYQDSDLSTEKTVDKLYTATGTATNCFIDGTTSWSGYISGSELGTSKTFKLTADGTNYILPSSVTLNGLSAAYTRTNDTTGTLWIHKASGSNPNFSIEGQAVSQ